MSPIAPVPSRSSPPSRPKVEPPFYPTEVVVTAPEGGLQVDSVVPPQPDPVDRPSAPRQTPGKAHARDHATRRPRPGAESWLRRDLKCVRWARPGALAWIIRERPRAGRTRGEAGPATPSLTTTRSPRHCARRSHSGPPPRSVRGRERVTRGRRLGSYWGPPTTPQAGLSPARVTAPFHGALNSPG